MERTYNSAIDKSVHDSQTILKSILEEVSIVGVPVNELKDVVTNEFRERLTVWSKFEKGEIIK